MLFPIGISKNTLRNDCMEKYIKEISEVQDGYYEIVKSYEDILQTSDKFSSEAMLLIESVKKFWLRKSDSISLMLDSLTKSNDSILLCGAIYLGIEDNEEYIFSTFGSHHFLNDPFTRMEPFLLGQSGNPTPDAQEYFRDVYKDTLKIFALQPRNMMFLPLLQLYHAQIKDYQETLNHGYWGVISSLFNSEYSSISDIRKTFNDITCIENALPQEALKNLIFTDNTDANLNLSQRLNKYFKENENMLAIPCDNMVDKFVIATYAQITQVLELLLMCLFFNVIPFIRNKITFHYLMLLGGSFMEHKEISLVIIKAVIIYLFYNSVDRRIFDSINFSEYAKKMKGYNLFGKVLSRLDCTENSFFKKSAGDTIMIIQDELQKNL